MTEPRTPQEIEDQLEAMLAEAEQTVTSLRGRLAALRAEHTELNDDEDVDMTARQHEAVDHLETYMEDATIHWRRVLEYFEEALAEIGIGRNRGRAGQEERDA